MGLLKDTISTAWGSNQPNNGFKSSDFGFGRNGRDSSQRNRSRLPPQAYDRRTLSPQDHRYSGTTAFYYNRGSDSETDIRYHGSQHATSSSTRSSIYDSSDRGNLITRKEMPRSRNEKAQDQARQTLTDSPPPYEQQQSHTSYDRVSANSSRNINISPRHVDYSYNQTSSQNPFQDSRHNPSWRPLVLPQITFGKGQPFLRAYSDELERFGVSEQHFIQMIDEINVAVTPNPENQIFQKAASIAGWFVPGAAGIGMMVGQIGVGIGAAVFGSHTVAQVLSKANLELFVPNGLEICICSTDNVDAEVGFSYYSHQERWRDDGTPESRLASYGNLIAPLSVVLPPHQGGRNDPIAIIGRNMANKDDQKKAAKAQKRLARGKNRNRDRLETDSKWLMVRQATPDAIQCWQEVLQQSRMAQEQEQANLDSQREYRR